MRLDFLGFQVIPRAAYLSTEETWCRVYKGGRISARISTAAVKPPREKRKGRRREPLRVHNGAHMFAGVYNVPRSIGTSIDLLAFVLSHRVSSIYVEVSRMHGLTRLNRVQFCEIPRIDLAKM